MAGYHFFPPTSPPHSKELPSLYNDDDIRSTMSFLSASILSSSNPQPAHSSPSILLPPPPAAADAPVPASDTLPALAREIAHLERRLQQLLDAQSDGLLAGLGQAPSPMGHRSSPSPPAAPRHASTSRTRSPSSTRAAADNDDDRPLPLDAARAHIRTTLRRLARLRAAQAAALRAQREPLRQFLARADALGAKRARLEVEIARRTEPATSTASPAPPSAASPIRSTPSQSPRPAGRTSRPTSPAITPLTLPPPPPLPAPDAPDTALAAAEALLESHIDVLATHLTTLRQRLETVRARQARRANRAAADLSSWRGAREALTSQIAQEVLAGGALAAAGAEGARYLERARRRATAGGAAGEGGEKSVSVWALKAERRTLEMVREAVAADAAALEDGAHEAEREGGACAEGARRWAEVVKEVGRVEARLRSAMGASTAADGKGKAEAAESPERAMRGIVALMGEVGEKVVVVVGEARERGWSLLACAAGAEAEALRQAREMLRGVLGDAAGTEEDGADGEPEGAETAGAEMGNGSGGSGRGSRLVDVDEAREEHESDAPGPDLLVSHLDGA